MSDNNKLPKQARSQEFELVELLFRECISYHIARPNIEYSFQARFQSFIDQIPSYLHSVSKIGFFTHFFFGSFASLLDTKLVNKLGIQKLHFNFDSVYHLRIVAETNDKTYVFIFTENNKNKQQKKNKDIVFTKDEWKTITGKEYTDDDNKKLEISVIQINKSIGSINVAVEKQDIQDGVSSSTKQYNEITKQFVDAYGKYIVLEDEILKLTVDESDKSKDALKLILEYTKKIHDRYQGLPYGDKAREADEHGFVAGIFNNFRYRENAHVYLEQFAGKGYADIVLLVRGVNRATESIPIIIELKAGTGSGTNVNDALKQVEEYTKGFQPNNMRILSLADNILCVGMNLDSPANSFMVMRTMPRQTKVIPVIQQIINQLNLLKDISNPTTFHDHLITIQQAIKKYLEHTYNTFPSTGEKSSAHYMSRFLLGESLVLIDYDKHIFIYDKASYIPTVTVIDDHDTRSKKLKIERIVDGSNAVNTMLFISVSDTYSPAILVNIIDANKNVIVNNKRLDSGLIGQRKIIQLNIQFNIDQYKKSFEEYCNIKLLKIYNSISEYNKASVKVEGTLHLVNEAMSDNLLYALHQTISAQEGFVILESRYKELMGKVARIVYPIKSLIGRESEFQGLLEGIFKYYSDAKLSERSERRELVLTEFQTGVGGRIDMLIQVIGPSAQGTKEYIPVGLELKYYNSIKLNKFETKQDKQIQRLILRHKEEILVKKLLNDQIERYAQGAAIKSITDGNKVAIMGIVFNARAEHPSKLLLSTDKFLEADIVHSSKLYSISNSIVVRNVVKKDLPLPDSAYFEPDWIEQETYDTLARAQGEDRDRLLLFNKNLDDKKIKKLRSLLKHSPNLQSIDGLDLASNIFTAASLKGLTDILATKLVYLDLTDNDLAEDNFADLKEVIKDIKVPILKIADIGMNDVQMQRIIELLTGQDKVSHLEIQHIESLKMTPSLADSISIYLQDSKMLEYLDLSKTGIDNNSIVKISKGLKDSVLHTLVLRDNDIGKIGVEALGTALARSVISNIDLSGNPLGVYGVDALVKSVNNNAKIEQLELVDVNLKYIPDIVDLDKRKKAITSNEKLLSIMDSLFSNPHLSKIDISYNDIGNSGLQKIFSTLKDHIETSKLQDLSLAGNKINLGAHDLGIKVITELIHDYISQTRVLRSLDLSLMELSDEIGVKIVSALENNFSLIHFDLSGNDKIGSGTSRETIKSLANVLKTHQYLKYLNLSNNKLRTEDLKLILGSLKKNQVVSHINLSGNDFSGIIADQNNKQYLDLNNQNIDFENLLHNNTELKYLNLAKCKLSAESLKALFAALKENSSLEVLDIRDNIISNEIIEAIVEALRTNAQNGLNGLKILHISKEKLDHVAISKLTDKSLGILVLVDGDILPNVTLEESLMQTCVIDGVKKQSALELDTEHQTFESETIRGNYHYWLQAHDILDIARTHYGYGNRAIELVGSTSQLSEQITQYFANSNYARPFTMILNIGANGQGGNHWVSLVLNRVNGINHGYYIDSVGNNIDGNIANILIQHRILIHNLSTQQQEDGYNCGLWALDNARRISELLEANSYSWIDNVDIKRNNLFRSINEEQFQQIREDILRELTNDNQRRINLENIGLHQVKIPTDYNDDYELYMHSQVSYEQCAMLSRVGGYNKSAKSKRSITENNENKLLLNSKKFVDCAYDVKHNVIYYKLMSLVNHFKVVGDNESCKAIDKLIINQRIINRLDSIDKIIPIEIINIKDAGYDWSPLHIAAQLGDVEKVRQLIIKDSYVNISTRDGWTPLHLAGQYANPEVIRILRSKGAYLTYRSEYEWWTVLHLASQSGDKEVTRVLIEEFKKNNKSISIKSKGGWTPLHLAIQLGDKEVIDLLVKEGSDVNAPAKGGWRPLHLASRYNNTEVVDLLLATVSEVNSQVIGHNKWTALHFAAQLGNKKMIKSLKHHGANPAIHDDDDKTAIDIAKQYGTQAIMDLVNDERTIKEIETTTKLIEKKPFYSQKIASTTTENPWIKCGRFGCRDLTDLRKKRMLQQEKDKLLENIQNQNDDIETKSVIRAELDTNHHKHRHHHGENNHREEHYNQDILGHHRGRRDIVDKLPKIFGDNNDNNMPDFRDDIGKSNTDSRLHPIVVHNTIGTKQTISQDATKMIGDKTPTIIDSVNNKLLVDWQGNLLLGYLLFGKKCGSRKCDATADTVIKDSIDSEYAHRLAYSSYAPSVEEHQEKLELLGVNER